MRPGHDNIWSCKQKLYKKAQCGDKMAKEGSHESAKVTHFPLLSVADVVRSNYFNIILNEVCGVVSSLADLLGLFCASLSNAATSFPGPSLSELREKRGNDFSKSLSAQHSTWAEIEKQPYFLPTTTAVTVQEGQHAFFICKVENLYNQTVSWLDFIAAVIKNAPSSIQNRIVSLVSFLDKWRLFFFSTDTDERVMEFHFLFRSHGYEAKIHTCFTLVMSSSLMTTDLS